MKWFQGLPVAAKLVLSFLVVAAVGAGVSGLGIFHMGRINASTESLYNNDLRAIKAVQAANIHLLDASRAQMGLLSAGTKGERNVGFKELKEAVAALESSVADVKPLLEQTNEGRELHEQYQKLMPPLKKHLADFADLIARQTLDSSQFEGNVPEESALLLKESRALEKVLQNMVAFSDQQARASMEDAAGTFKHSRLLMLLLALAGVAISLGLGVVVARLLAGQLGGELRGRCGRPHRQRRPDGKRAGPHGPQRQPAVLHQADARPADRRRRADQDIERCHRYRLGPDCRGQPGSVIAH
jgi:methyl-accepting chemotaxis protein